METDIAPAPTPKYRRLTQQQLVTILEMHKLHKTQVEIAQVIGCDHRTIGRALAQFTDSTAAATAHLRGNALRMAQNIVKKGLPRDHVQALRGVGVLAEDQPGSGLVIQIGIKDSDVTFACETSALTSDLHKLTD